MLLSLPALWVVLGPQFVRNWPRLVTRWLPLITRNLITKTHGFRKWLKLASKISSVSPATYLPWYQRSNHGSYFYARPDLKSIVFDVPNSVIVEDVLQAVEAGVDPEFDIILMDGDLPFLNG